MPGIGGANWCHRYNRAIDSRLVDIDRPPCIEEHNGCGNCPDRCYWMSRSIGRGLDTGRIHAEINQAIRVQLNDELFQAVWDRLRKDCPDLPEWRINTIAIDIFGMLLVRSLKFTISDESEP